MIFEAGVFHSAFLFQPCIEIARKYLFDVQWCEGNAIDLSILNSLMDYLPEIP